MMKYAAIVGVFLLLLVGVYWFTRGLATAPVQLPSDVRLGFIRTIETGSNFQVLFDDAEWLTGKAGEDAAIAAGICTEGTRSECLPNGYFIRNDADATVAIPLADTAIIALFTLEMEKNGVKETNITPTEFAALINDTPAHWAQLPYQVLIEDGRVTIVEEVYIP